ncbi:MAG: chorismate lyase [Gammaproteobacteria bacterium]
MAAWPKRQLQTVSHWLLDTDSLTQRLQLCGATFSVQRRSQAWRLPTLSERYALSLPQRQTALIREVVLMANGQPVVFARSVFPHATLTGELRWLRHLQNRSLGSILFRNPWLQRSPFEIARLAGDTPLLPDDLHQQAPAWGRRSVFLINRRPLLVGEIFLECFRPWSSSRSVQRSQRRWSGRSRTKQ